jgi:hypothetical protein
MYSPSSIHEKNYWCWAFIGRVIPIKSLIGIINASIIVNTTTIRTIYVGLKRKPIWEYVLTTKAIHGSIMLIHVFVIQLPHNIYYGLF